MLEFFSLGFFQNVKKSLSNVNVFKSLRVRAFKYNRFFAHKSNVHSFLGNGENFCRIEFSELGQKWTPFITIDFSKLHSKIGRQISNAHKATVRNS